MWNPFPLMHVSFWGKWTSRMSMSLKDYRQLFQLTKKRLAEIHVRQSEQLRKYTIILRLLYARVGKPICPIHGTEISSQTIQQMVDRLMELPDRTRIQVLAPIVSGRKGTHVKLFEEIKKEGYVRVRVNGEIIDLDDNIELNKNKSIQSKSSLIGLL